MATVTGVEIVDIRGYYFEIFRNELTDSYLAGNIKSINNNVITNFNINPVQAVYLNLEIDAKR